MMRAILLTLGLVLASTGALAMTLQEAMAKLDQAKVAGLIGEQPDGYLGVVTVKDDAVEVARLINEARRAEYQKLADKNGITLNDVQAVAARKAFEKTTSGNFLLVNGQWIKK